MRISGITHQKPKAIKGNNANQDEIIRWIKDATSSFHQPYISVPQKPGLFKRMFIAIGIRVNPTYENIPRPTRDVMDAFRQSGLTDIEIAKLVEDIKSRGVTEDKKLIEIANETLLPTEKLEQLQTAEKKALSQPPSRSSGRRLLF